MRTVATMRGMSITPSDPPATSIPAPAPPPGLSFRGRDLGLAVAQYANAGWQVQATTPTSAVLVDGPPTNHVLHVLVSIFTCGLWLPVWLIVAMTAKQRRVTLMVDPYGNVVATEPFTT